MTMVRARRQADQATRASTEPQSALSLGPSASVLRALADRCERATGPDRELDTVIFQAIGNCLHTPIVREVSWSDGTKDLVPVCTKCGAKNVYQEWRMFTRSLDTAMGLVPEGWRFASSETMRGDFYAHLITRELVTDGARAHAEATANSLALALCAAALRALASAGEAGTATDSEAGVAAKP